MNIKNTLKSFNAKHISIGLVLVFFLLISVSKIFAAQILEWNFISGDYETLLIMNDTKQTTMQDPVSADPGDQLRLLVYYHCAWNDPEWPTEKARNTGIRINFPTQKSQQIVSVAQLWADNVPAIDDNGTINVSSAEKLIFQNTAEWHHNGQVDNISVALTQDGGDWDYGEVNIGDISCDCVNCYNNAGTVVFRAQISDTVVSPPTVDIKANGSDGPVTIDYNQTANLTWTSSNADTCTASGNWYGSKAISNTIGESTGSLVSGTYIYIIDCSGPGGSASDSVTVNVNPQPSFLANLNIVKTVRNITQGNTYYQNVISANPSDLLGFKIQVSSVGNGTANNVMLRDVLSSLINYQGNLLIDGFPIAGGNIFSGINLGTMPAGQSKTITFQASAASESNFGYGTISLVNTAQTWADNVGQISDSVTVNVTRPIPAPESPGLNVDKTVRNITDNTGFQTSVSAGPLDEIEFKITIQSIGTTTAQNITVKDALPAGLNYEGDLKINGSAWGGSIISGLNIGNLSPGVSKTITFKAQINSETDFDYGTTTLVNTVSVGADTLSKVYDSAVVNIAHYVLKSNRELSVQKKVRNLTKGQTQWYETIYASPSDKIIFRIQATNTGDSKLYNVMVKDGLPDKIDWYGNLEIDGNDSKLDITHGIDIGNLNINESKIITFEALVAKKHEFIYGTTDLINTALAYNGSASDTDTAKVRVQKASVAGAVTEVPTGVLDSLIISFGVTVLISYCFLLGHFFYQKTGMNLGNEIVKTKTAAQNWCYDLSIFDSPEKSQKRLEKTITELRKSEV